MAKRPSSQGSRTQSFNVGRDAVGAVQNAGDNTRVDVTATVAPATPPQVLEALAAIQAAFAVNPATKALADAAADQVKTKEPDKCPSGNRLRYLNRL